ncbi:MAG: hypothetical protein AUI33_11330 [Ignavibacteria bacterium 13_1_40CM_2_61_4]|nr:MAG: hypothetical protein AUI33_11330 [Ignavibacteria bacterium 13_1_40CM_2_61_4]
MKHSRILLLLLILFPAATANAQAEKGEWKRPKHNGRITADYDRTNDQTKLDLALMPVTCVRDGCIFISLESSFSGSKLKSPVDRIIFGVAIVTKTLKPFATPKLVLQLDGEPMDLGEMTFAGDVPAGDLTGLPYGISLTSDELAKIAGAHKVEVDLSGFRFALGDNQLNAIKDYNHRARTIQ